MSGPANAGLAVILFGFFPVVIAFAIALWLTRGIFRTVVWCLLSAAVAVIVTWYTAGVLMHADLARGSECIHEQYLQSLKHK